MDSNPRHLPAFMAGVSESLSSYGTRAPTEVRAPWRVRLVRGVQKRQRLQIQGPALTHRVTDPGHSAPEKPLLLSKVGLGDSSAMEDCIRTHGPLVWSIVQRRVQDRTDAEDLTQEIFTEVWKCAGRYQPSIASESGFIAMIARRRAIDWLRKRQRQPEIGPLPETGDYPAETTDPGAAHDRDQMWETLGELPEDTRHLFTLHFHQGMSHAEIASATGLPLGSVKTGLRRGLIEARALLKRREIGNNPSAGVLS